MFRCLQEWGANRKFIAQLISIFRMCKITRGGMHSADASSSQDHTLSDKNYGFGRQGQSETDVSGVCSALQP